MISISEALGQTGFVLLLTAVLVFTGGGIASTDPDSKVGPVLMVLGGLFGVLTLVCVLASIWTKVG